MDVLTSEQTQRAPSPPTVPHNDTELHDNRHYGNGKGRKSRASVLCQISTAPVNCLMGLGVACTGQTLFEERGEPLNPLGKYRTLAGNVAVRYSTTTSGVPMLSVSLLA